MKNIMFVPAEWDIDSDCHATVAEIKKFQTYKKNKKVLGWQMGDWNYSWSVICSDFNLIPGEEYRFNFWLNGGENERHDEICELEIFGEDWNARQTFALNRNHTKPILYKGGWYLFSIPFTATDETMTMRFNVQRAVCSLIPASYTDIETADMLESDEEDTTKLQRSNIVYKHGYPPAHPDSLPIRLGKLSFSIPKKALFIGGGVLAALTVLLLIFRAIKKFFDKKTSKLRYAVKALKILRKIMKFIPFLP